MVVCPACSTEVPPDGERCPRCGGLLPTRAEPTGPLIPPNPIASAGRLAVGDLLAGRYRVVARLGKGGMGEVWRADDLSLGQSVALKFLPSHLADDPDRLRRLRNEVKLARQVSHPNACRVYDLAEDGGRAFLIMEFVDGEDLAALLKKVGRLPEERGLEIARQLCGALAATHDRGVIHRDLKPANVMLDGRGEVRLTDFGLALSAEDMGGTNLAAGTPAYMAPEQLTGEGVSVRSDLYALGLILYEVFTGKRALPADSREELRRRQESGEVVKPSGHVTGLDSKVERAILRCLERRPEDRPSSAHEVLASLPGGDPLLAALAKGETPSPAAVADAPVEGTLNPVVAASLLVVVLAGVVGWSLLADHIKIYRRVPLAKSPELLTADARRILERLGHGEPFGDSAWWFIPDGDYLRWVRENDPSRGRWDGLAAGRPAAMTFWYGQSPAPMAATAVDYPARPGSVMPTHPPHLRAGMASVFLDTRGRLLEFQVVPPALDDDAAAGPEPDWRAAFAEAGFDPDDFEEATPRWNPRVGFDHRRAWVVKEGRSEVDWRVEAAAYRGRVVSFRVVGPWNRPRPEISAYQGSGQLASVAGFALVLVVFAVGGALAWRNVRDGRADIGGARRLGVFVVAVMLGVWLVLSHHVPAFRAEMSVFLGALGDAVLMGGWVTVSYLAVEPWVRRRWPWRIVAWRRVMEGRWRDPLVGRDALLGCAVGTAIQLLAVLHVAMPGLLGLPPTTPDRNAMEYITNAPARVLFGFAIAACDAMMWFLVLFLLIRLCRSEWLGAVVLVLVGVPYWLIGEGDYLVFGAVLTAIDMVLGILLVLRFGIWALAVSMFYSQMLRWLPLTTDLNTFYRDQTLLAWLVVLAVPFYGFVVSLGGRPLLGKGFLGDD